MKIQEKLFFFITSSHCLASQVKILLPDEKESGSLLVADYKSQLTALALALAAVYQWAKSTAVSLCHGSAGRFGFYLEREKTSSKAA